MNVGVSFSMMSQQPCKQRMLLTTNLNFILSICLATLLHTTAQNVA